MNSFERFKEKRLPARKDFFSSTNKEKIGDDDKKLDGHISFKDYLICEKVWDKFDIKDMGDYHDHYLKKDVLLFSICFWKVYWYLLRILWAWSLSLFQFSWIELRCDVKNDWCKINIDKYLFTEKGSRGGISYISKGYAKANKIHEWLWL